MTCFELAGFLRVYESWGSCTQKTTSDPFPSTKHVIAPSIFSKCHMKHDFVVILGPVPKRGEGGGGGGGRGSGVLLRLSQ